MLYSFTYLTIEITVVRLCPIISEPEDLSCYHHQTAMVRALYSKCASLLTIHFPFLFYISTVHTYRMLKITRAKDIDWNNTEKMGNYFKN